MIQRHSVLSILAAAVASLLILTAACDTTELDIENPNEPTPEVLRTEEGANRLAQGFYDAFDLAAPKNFAWIVQIYHELMGDALVTPWGNWQFRWLSQVESITLDDGSVFVPPTGGTQPQEIARVNSREQDTESAVIEEWGSMYFLNNEANLLLQLLDEGSIEFSGDAAAKEAGYRAWAHFWKGYAYARVGSIYEQGLILDDFGQTQANFVDRAEVIAESDRQFDLAIDAAGSFDAVADNVIPELFFDSEVSNVTGASLAQAAYTLKARNLLVNTPVDEMTPSEWTQIRNWTQQGLQSNTGTFVLRHDDITFPAEIFNRFVPRAVWGPRGWHRVSERLIQDIRPGDERLDNFQQTLDADGNPETWSTRGRGIQYNSTWRINSVDNAGQPIPSRYASSTATQDFIKWYFVSFEENLLMQAEAELALGSPGLAASLIDQVREYQSAGLDPVSSSGDVQAELRSERRVGLFLRGLAFYDARRWGVLEEGRSGAVVVENDNTINTAATIQYGFLAYWPIPDEELTFNRPEGGGEPGGPS